VTARLFEGERTVDAIAVGHRGTTYGDGVFETMRVHDGQLPWWPRHARRLADGATRLRVPLPDREFLEAQVVAMASGQEAGVLRLVLSRGGGGRGYAPEPDAAPCWQLSVHPLPPEPPSAGLQLRWCATRLAVQPLLAGLKHCNRLEQVMARDEWQQPGTLHADADEGLMRDTGGHVVCAVSANLFVLRDGCWLTPKVDRCGVAGVCRQWALEALDATEARLAPGDVEGADAVFLCNAVRGILPVARLGARTWDAHRAVADARRRLAAAHPAFS
jgi:4-amino-4-deoxychorismate lyase